MGVVPWLPPTLTRRRISTYTVLGFAGYAAANVLAILLASRWQLGLDERLVAFLAPPTAFVVVVTIATALAGGERIVFYQTACAGVAAVALVGWVLGARVDRLLDVACLGIGVFLVFGRVGCHAVACCHGRLGHGVVYGPQHVALGFSERWCGRALWPVQLVEAAASAGLVAVALAWSERPGTAALVYGLGYAGVRFALELARGDHARPYALGLSEAQWFACATSIACALWSPSPPVLVTTGGLLGGAVLLVATRRRRARFLPPHLGELGRLVDASAHGTRRVTSLGVAVSRHALPDGRTDWVLSGDPAIRERDARRLATHLWPTWELVRGRSAGVFHLITR